MIRMIQNLTLALVAILLWAGAPTLAQRAPDWMEGRYEGAGRIDGKVITIDVSRDGVLTATSRGNRRDAERLPASYRRSILTIDDRDYTVERTADGFRAIPRDVINDRNRDSLRTILFRRIEAMDRASDRRPPTWMVGRFEATSRQNPQRVVYTITNQGDVTVTDRRRDQTNIRGIASYRRSELNIDGRAYRVEEIRDGFRAIPVSLRSDRPADRNLEITFRRITAIDDRGNGRNGVNQLPDWFDGTYTGFSRRDSLTMIVRLDRRGDLTLVVRGTDLRNRDSSVSYRRGVLTMDGRDYTIERTPEGFRAIPADSSSRNRDSEISFRHTGN